ncbi:phage major capsid protein [uncultured Nitratireductor sp.]|uniref:phage major capsid protein n=1 Tax=uncultured Nitratireductor sp. TaxID=520953 RepID=UPI0026129C16|nr:phage major capsid protein [uncultured Nitratireductor sp.]
MQHVTKGALRGSVAITRKGEDDDPISIVTKSLEELQKTVNERLTAVEEKAAGVKVEKKGKKDDEEADLDMLQKRLAELEKKANRPAGGGNSDEQAEVERKALSSLLRSGASSGIEDAGGSFESKAASSDSDPAGGYFVLPTVDLTIRNLMTDLSPMRSLAEVVSIASDKYERFYSLGKRGAKRVSEREERPQDTSRPELIKHSYGVGEYYAAPVATRHLLDDAATDIASWLINNATHDFAETEGEDFMTYDGSDGFPRGLLTYPVAPQKDFARDWGKFQYVTTGATPDDAKLADALIKLVATLRKPYKANAVFVMNSNTAIRLRQIKDSTGRYLWAPTGNLIEGVDHPLLGQRVEIDENMPDIAADAFPIAFGDFRQGYVIVERQGVRINRDELTQKGRVVFDVYKRVGGGAGDFNAIKFLKIAAS